MDKKHLTRFPIDNLKQELEINMVAGGRHLEYIKFFRKYLNDDKYYCLSPTNPERPENAINCYGKTSRSYNADGSSMYFTASEVEIGGNKVPAIIQKINPKTHYEFCHMEDYVTVYLSQSTINELCKNL